MQRSGFRIWALAIVCHWGGVTDLAAAPPDFARDIRPLLSNKCFKCHGPADQQAELRLDLRDPAIETRAIVPGDPSLSELLTRVAADDDTRMPPHEAGERLTAEEVQLLRDWIAAGAEYTPHWAFESVNPQPPPPTMSRDDHQPLDTFVRVRLTATGLEPSPEADRSTLIRRLSLDLRGVLPTPEETSEYLADTRPDAYERLVDRFLASPHYGERQARHWLDAARYADSNGYTIDGPRSIWPWRDWVIGALNGDLPFDEFTVQQLAGDLLPNATREQLVATGFHRNTSFNEEGGTDKEQFRTERTIDRTNTTGTVWLGLTVGCAQCHDHKYDPVSQREYYELYAFLNNVDEPVLPLSTPEQDARIAQLRNELKAAKESHKSTLDKRPLDEKVAELKTAVKSGYVPLPPREATADPGTMLTRQDDSSLLAEGEVADAATYVVEGWSRLKSVTAVRLEALADERLPKSGPGRASNGNFVLSEFRFEVNGQPVKFSRALADHSQPNYDVADVLLARPDKGWAINGATGSMNVNRTAIFVLEQPAETNDSINLKFTLKFSGNPAKYALGRFRISLTDAEGTYVNLPVTAQQLLLKPIEELAEDDRTSLDGLLKQSAETLAREAEVKRIEAAIKAVQAEIPSTLILRETSPRRSTHIFDRGDFLSLLDEVAPTTPDILPPLSNDDRVPNRLDLARWLTRPDHPLTSRVTVNRFWQQFFGIGIVETENDFGYQGAFPTHPELLDWLAADFVASGWQVKRLFRQIVTSSTYRRASHHREDLAAADPYNRLLGRQNRIRLEAEIIRDAALSAAGVLDNEIGGAGVYPYQPPEVFSFTQSQRTWNPSEGSDRFRRGMYTYFWRQSRHPLFTTFDGPDAQTACTRRNRSNTPLQALHLANDPVFVELAGELGRRLAEESSANPSSRLDEAYRICFSREPRPEERERLLAFLEQHREADEVTRWTLLSRVLLNLDEFINRE